MKTIKSIILLKTCQYFYLFSDDFGFGDDLTQRIMRGDKKYCLQ